MGKDQKRRANYLSSEKARIEMCKDEEFQYPADFLDVEQPEPAPDLPEFKASSVLYVSSASFTFGGVLMILLETMTRKGNDVQDTFVELLEWNPYTQMGAFGIAIAMFLFWLGLMTDRRGA